ncbi:unnamed protein product [Phytophthora fragariaefolia]|uniref:Unnamed protein product n=1 Tax=Phytophthora fragariaefolia TaxID=1490495 RepID=A0A9W6U0S5_9STRA|nr:unnamed protein product [Phytophthora fragariaefolia]
MPIPRLKYLREEIAASVYCFNAWQKYKLHGVIGLLVYTKTEAEYAKHIKYMVHLASTDPGTTVAKVARQFKKEDFSPCGQTRRAAREAIMSDKHVNEQHKPLPPQLTQSGETATLSGELSGATHLPTQATEMPSAPGELPSVSETLSSEKTYHSAAELLSKFKVFEYCLKSRAPTARKMSNLPPPKSMIQLGSISRILRPEYIKMRSAKVSALQAKSKGLTESDAVLDIIGLGVYATETLNAMKRGHGTMKAIKNLNKGIEWIDTIDFTSPMAASFQCSADTDLLFRMKGLPLMSTKTDIPELVGRNQLPGTTINTVMERLFGARIDVVTVDPAVIGQITSHCYNSTWLRRYFCRSVHGEFSHTYVLQQSALVQYYDRYCAQGGLYL